MIRIALVIAVAAATAVSATGTWLAGAGTALAPEPLMLTQGLPNSTGATAAGYFISSGVQSEVVRWPGTWTANTTLTADRPCSTEALGPWTQTTRRIQANGNYRKCV